MPEILAENLSGKDVMGSDGKELGSLYNITMDLSSGALNHLVIEPADSLHTTDFEYSEEGHLLVPVEQVTAVKDHMIVDR
ncbi:PRC-barrel domain-containing protein [Haloarcula litorea]|uniref:PRC-barrel domain-containing protein n=1 Tax=Haloarcula litorea TaxID=3032579 RepID=UPI0023E8DFE0|nr:PRC-barrel domain-containing protein [Halomicroarcula sp. GDY20]